MADDYTDPVRDAAERYLDALDAFSEAAADWDRTDYSEQLAELHAALQALRAEVRG